MAKRTFIFSLLITTFLGEAAFAQNTGAEFLYLGAGGRGMGMAGAYTALTDDVTSSLWNPAGIASTRSVQTYLSYMSLYRNLASYNFAAVGFPLSGRAAISVSLVRLSVDQIPRYGPLQGTILDRITNPALQSSGQPEGYFSSADYAVLFTLAKGWGIELIFGSGLAPYSVPIRILAGINMKFIQRNLDEANASAQGLDAGLILEFLGPVLSGTRQRQRTLSIGIALFDVVNSRLNWSTGTGYADPLPLRPVFGIAYKQRLEQVNSEISVTLDTRMGTARQMRAGMEYVLYRTLALRAGWRPESWSIGAGLRLSKIQVDYSFSAHELGGTHRIGGGFRL